MARNQAFFGCNYNDKRIKGQFDSLKARLEREYPLVCVIVDKVAARPASDFWQDIIEGITNASVCFFDVTAFRSNVVLELGHALAARKGDDVVFITWRNRKKGGKEPAWALSDISHLHRHEYKTVTQLRGVVEGQLKTTSFMKDIADFRKICGRTQTPHEYYALGVDVMREMRDRGSLGTAAIAEILRGSSCEQDALMLCLQDSRLVRRRRGRYGHYVLNV